MKNWCKYYNGMHDNKACEKGVLFNQLPDFGTFKFDTSCPCFGPTAGCNFASYPDTTTTQQSPPSTMKILQPIIDKFKADEDFAWTWHCNLVCLLLDEGVQHERANRRVADFMKNAFEIDVTKFASWIAFETHWKSLPHAAHQLPLVTHRPLVTHPSDLPWWKANFHRYFNVEDRIEIVVDSTAPRLNDADKMDPKSIRVAHNQELGAAIESVCETLPPGYFISIGLQFNNSEIVLLADDGVACEFPSKRESLASMLKDALEFAIEDAKRINYQSVPCVECIQWVDVNDDMPEHGLSVLVLCAHPTSNTREVYEAIDDEQKGWTSPEGNAVLNVVFWAKMPHGPAI